MKSTHEDVMDFLSHSILVDKAKIVEYEKDDSDGTYTLHLQFPNERIEILGNVKSRDFETWMLNYYEESFTVQPR